MLVLLSDTRHVLTLQHVPEMCVDQVPVDMKE